MNRVQLIRCRRTIAVKTDSVGSGNMFTHLKAASDKGSPCEASLNCKSVAHVYKTQAAGNNALRLL